jgi:hypothetical protein
VDLPDISETHGTAVVSGQNRDVWRGLAYCAGLAGTFFFSPALLWPIDEILRLSQGDGAAYITGRNYLLGALVGALALVPFRIALVRAGRDIRRRVMIAVLPGLIVGLVLSPMFYAGGFILWMAACVLGPVFGLLALGPCWWRGDTQGRALALLGIAPAICGPVGLAVYWVQDRSHEAAAFWGLRLRGKPTPRDSDSEE